VSFAIASRSVSGHNVTSGGSGFPSPQRNGVLVGGLLQFDGYCRRLDAFEYRAKRHDVPHDVVQLLGLASDLDLEDKITVDREHYSE
jgi:hypothetical protein